MCGVLRRIREEYFDYLEQKLNAVPHCKAFLQVPCYLCCVLLFVNCFSVKCHLYIFSNGSDWLTCYTVCVCVLHNYDISANKHDDDDDDINQVLFPGRHIAYM